MLIFTTLHEHGLPTGSHLLAVNPVFASKLRPFSVASRMGHPGAKSSGTAAASCFTCAWNTVSCSHIAGDRQ